MQKKNTPSPHVPQVEEKDPMSEIKDFLLSTISILQKKGNSKKRIPPHLLSPGEDKKVSCYFKIFLSYLIKSLLGSEAKVGALGSNVTPHALPPPVVVLLLHFCLNIPSRRIR